MSDTVDIINTIISRTPSGTPSVHASTQYGMGLIITYDGKIVFRNDTTHHSEREAIAAEVNYRIQQHE